MEIFDGDKKIALMLHVDIFDVEQGQTGLLIVSSKIAFRHLHSYMLGTIMMQTVHGESILKLFFAFHVFKKYDSRHSKQIFPSLLSLKNITKC